MPSAFSFDDWNMMLGGWCYGKMLGKCTVKGRALLWSLAFFHNMIDVAGLASHIIYKGHNPWFRTKDQSRKFLKNLAQRVMRAFDWSLHYQLDSHEKPFPSRCSRNGAWTTLCHHKKQQLPLPCIVAVMDPLQSLDVVIFAETRTGNNGRQEKAVLLVCSLFAMNISIKDNVHYLWK